jgi:WhiB family transcriptional regulator, redox-sensing transcriptional regulator
MHAGKGHTGYARRPGGASGATGVTHMYAQRASRGGGSRSRAATSQVPPCSSDPDLFFAEAPEDVERAKALCGLCPVQSACLAGALQRGEPYGVWGGALFLRGVVIPEKKRRGRPRKVSVPA